MPLHLFMAIPVAITATVANSADRDSFAERTDLVNTVYRRWKNLSANSLLPVSLTPVRNNQKNLKFIASANDNAEKLFAGVNDNANEFFGGVNDTGNYMKKKT